MSRRLINVANELLIDNTIKSELIETIRMSNYQNKSNNKIKTQVKIRNVIKSFNIPFDEKDYDELKNDLFIMNSMQKFGAEYIPFGNRFFKGLGLFSLAEFSLLELFSKIGQFEITSITFLSAAVIGATFVAANEYEYKTHKSLFLANIELKEKYLEKFPSLDFEFEKEKAKQSLKTFKIRVDME